MDPDQKPEIVEGEIEHEKFDKTLFEPVGVEQHPADAQDGDDPVREETREVTVSDMARDGFVFFTTALIITHGLFDRDPLVEFNRYHETEDDAERPFAVDCQYPFFQDVGQSVVNDELVNWDHRLYGIPEHNWPYCESFIKAIAMFDAKLYHYAKVGSHALTIVDPTKLHSTGVIKELPTVDITVFCVSGYRNFVWMAPAADPPRTRPFPKVDPPMSGIKAEAEALLGPPPSPEQLGRFNGIGD